MKTTTTTVCLSHLKETCMAFFLFYGAVSEAQSINITSGAGVSSTEVSDSLFDSNFTLSNVTESGSKLARGYFVNNGSNAPLNNGIIVSSGKASDANCPNNLLYGANTAFSFSNTPDNDLLTLVAPTSTFKDLYKLEADVVPNVDTLIFTYSFGSEEYLTYAPPLDMSGAYNDVFGIFVSGPGLTGNQNIATIPGSSSNVSVMTVNPIFNTFYFVNNVANLLLGTITPGTIQYNGFTKIMEAKIPVVKGQTYHVKVAIADMRDNIVDSGVFIKASGKNANNGVILPVELVKWNAENKGKVNLLNWKTSAENNNSHYIVERSKDGKTFGEISKVAGNGTTNALHSYQYEDINPNTGDNYYRLKQVDFNGNYKYSSIVMANDVKQNSTANILETYPNPANGNFNIRVQSIINEQSTIEILDMVGKQVFQQGIELQEGNNEFHFDIDKLPHGTYFVRLASQTQNQAHRIFN